MKHKIILSIRDELTKNIDEATRINAHRFFKEPVTFYGVKTATVGKIAKKHFKETENESKETIYSLCEELLRSDYSEEAFIAFDWAYRLRKSYEPADFEIFERWLATYVNNWAKCDTFCNHAIGAFIERFPQFIPRLKDWTDSDNRWIRRAAAVTLILPARNGRFLSDIFDIANRLLTDRDDLVQKGYGWMLKEASKALQNDVFDYVMRHKKLMPRTALRYAIEKMPAELKLQAMSKK